MKNLKIKPLDINADVHFWGAFGHLETEVSAHHIVKFCQKKGNWESFTYKEINDYYESWGHKYFTFNNLLDEKFIIEKNNKYFITEEFVTRCHKSSPK